MRAINIRMYIPDFRIESYKKLKTFSVSGFFFSFLVILSPKLIKAETFFFSFNLFIRSQPHLVSILFFLYLSNAKLTIVPYNSFTICKHVSIFDRATSVIKKKKIIILQSYADKYKQVVGVTFFF
jgi:hypothetical protein